MTVDADMTLACARLARTSPDAWGQLMEAFRAYGNQQTTNCIQSTLEELPRSQGRAQNAAHLFAVFADCLSSADKIESKKK